MRLELIAKFSGAEADLHHVPAYEAVETLYGVARSLIIPINYLAEGRVRYKNYGYNGYKINLVTNRPGSFETVFEVLLNLDLMTVTGGLALGVFGNFATDIIKTVYRRTIGRPGEDSISRLTETGVLKGGDIDAMVDAVEPAVRKAHTSIGKGANNIVIISGDNNVVRFDRTTKEYVNTSVNDQEIRSKRFSVGSFNANDNTGRVYDSDLGRTVAFQINKGSDIETIRAISNSIGSYALSRAGAQTAYGVALKYTRMLDMEGRVKKIFVIKARKELDEL